MAVLYILATSLPAHGSVIAKQMNLSPLRQGETTRSMSSYDPNLITGGRPIPNAPRIPH